MLAKGWDYVVIGAGAAGCVVAGRLSEMMPDARIALIEAGRERLGPDDEGARHRVHRQHLCPAKLEFPDGAGTGAKRAQAVGGFRAAFSAARAASTACSICAAIRSNTTNGRSVAVMGGRSTKCCLTSKKPRPTAAAAIEWHGDDGPIAVKQSRLDLPICDAFLAAASEAGYPVVDDLNTDVVEGFGRIDTNIGKAAAQAPRWLMRSRPGGGVTSNCCRKRSRHGSSSKRAGEGGRDHPARHARNGVGGA